MKILLTGATGFLGSHLLKKLLSCEYEIAVLKRSFSNCWRIQNELENFKTYNLDQITLQSILQEFRPEVVIHCATAYGRSENSTQNVIQSNLIFPLNLLDVSVKYGCHYFINTSSFFCKQLPERLLNGKKIYMPDYTISKYQFREWGKARALDGKVTFIDLQMEHIYGPDDNSDKFIPWVTKQLKEQVAGIELTSGVQQRDFIYVDDAVEVYLKVLTNLECYSGYQHFEVGTGNAQTVKSFVENLKTKIGSDTQLFFGALPHREEEIMYSAANPKSPFLSQRNI